MFDDIGDEPEGAEREMRPALARGFRRCCPKCGSGPLLRGYLKLRDRASYEFALASAAAVIALEDGTIREARLALGGVATKPWHAQEAEQSLRGQAPEVANFEKAAEIALRGATARRHNAFKIPLARQAIVRALEKATAASTHD